ncbi:MAG: hypothetical protein GT598_05705 [Bacteroidales bacterium]|nr:hypothetical protein [Bacteroidales bacterium]HPM18279.1 ankyrin repeat domain-containing protein [Bacteroidales bacterium]
MSEEATLPVLQLGPIYFFYSVPARIKLNDRIDLSFSRSSLITTYRYRLEIPTEGMTGIDDKLLSWSLWTNEDFTAIIIPDLDVLGTYKFTVEYKTGTGTLTRRFEKTFEVYSLSNLSSRARPVKPSQEFPVKKEALTPEVTQAEPGYNYPKTAQASAAATKEESLTPVPNKRISVAEAPATDNTSVRKDTQSTKQPDISAAPVQRTPINKKIQPSNVSNRKTPQIEKLAFPTSDISLFRLYTATGFIKPVNYSFVDSAANGVVTESDPAIVARVPVIIEKIKVDKPTGAYLVPEKTKAPPTLVAYHPPQVIISDQTITGEATGVEVYTSITNMADDAGIQSEIKISDTLISHNEPGPGKSEIQMEDLAASVGTIAGKPESDIAEDYLLKLLPPTSGKTAASSFNDMLLKAIEENDTALFRESILNGGGNDLAGINGGNVFHLLNGTIVDEYSVFLLKKNGNSIDKKDRNGNSPLHMAILNRDFEYAKCLINQGADLNLMNKMELAPLHLAAFLNEYRLSAFLMAKGAVADIAGNSGYTPLHIASELNNQTIAEQLLDH